MDLDQYLEKMITNTAFIWIRGVEVPKIEDILHLFYQMSVDREINSLFFNNSLVFTSSLMSVEEKNPLYLPRLYKEIREKKWTTNLCSYT